MTYSLQTSLMPRPAVPNSTPFLGLHILAHNHQQKTLALPETILVLGTQESAQKHPTALPPLGSTSRFTTQQETPALLEATKVLETPEDTHSTQGHAGIRNPRNPRDHTGIQKPRNSEAKQASTPNTRGQAGYPNTSRHTLLDLKTCWSPKPQATKARRREVKQKWGEMGDPENIQQRQTQKSAPKLIITPNPDDYWPA